MNKKILISLLILSTLFSGCSWDIIPYIRNFSNTPVTIKLESDYINDELDESLKIFLSKSILALDYGKEYAFTDTLNFNRIDSSFLGIEIPAKSTCLVPLSYGWSTGRLMLTFSYSSGKIDTLHKTLDYIVKTKKGNYVKNPTRFRRQIVYIDLKD